MENCQDLTQFSSNVTLEPATEKSTPIAAQQPFTIHKETTMKAIRIAAAVIGFGGAILSYPAFSAMYNVDPNAAVVRLRISCNEGNSPQVMLNNCFDTVTDLTNWISSTRHPSISSFLLVNVGPGTYPRLTCTDWGYTTFRGAGQSQTVFSGSGSGLQATRCTELEFQHLTISATTGYAPKGILWVGPGNSRWVDVNVIGGAYGWYEQDSGSSVCSDNVKGNAGKHYWFSSRIAVKGNTSFALSRAYYDACGSENWFFGSELLAEATSPMGLIAAYHQDRLSDTHFYGSVIRVNTSVVPSAYPAAAVIAAGAGSIHIHGTGIDVISTVASNNIAAIVAENGVTIHANGSAYNLDPGEGGIKTRIVNNGALHVHAPYLWEEHPNPPNIVSVNGADMAVENDCSAMGCQTTGTETHLLIYNDTCTSNGPWFDVVTHACR
jgi:hypothetical protein